MQDINGKSAIDDNAVAFTHLRGNPIIVSPATFYLSGQPYHPWMGTCITSSQTIPFSSIMKKTSFMQIPTSFPLMSRSFKLTKSHSISMHCYLLLSEAVGKHFKQSVPEGDKTGMGRGRKGSQVSACQNNDIKSGSWWWW